MYNNSKAKRTTKTKSLNREESEKKMEYGKALNILEAQDFEDFDIISILATLSRIDEEEAAEKAASEEE